MVREVDPGLIAVAEAAERRQFRIVAWTVVVTLGATVAGLIVWDGWFWWPPDFVFAAVLTAVLVPPAIVAWRLGRNDRQPVARRVVRFREQIAWLALLLPFQVVLESLRGVWPFDSEVYDAGAFAGQYVPEVPRPDHAALSALALIVGGFIWVGAGTAFLGPWRIRRPRLLGARRPWVRRALIIVAHAPLIVWVLVLAATVHAVEPNVEFDPSTGLPWSGWILIAAGWSIAVVLWTIGLPSAVRFVDVLAAAILVGHVAGFFKEVPIGLTATPISVGELTTTLELLVTTAAAATLALVLASPSPGEDRAAEAGAWILTSVAAVRTELHRNDTVPWRVDPEPRPPDQGLAVGFHDRVRQDD